MSFLAISKFDLETALNDLHIGVTSFFNIIAPEGGHQIFDCPIRMGYKLITEALLDIHDPLP